MAKSRVSVIIFNYNGKHMLDGCIKSVLKQDYKNYELYLLDNGSTDGSAEYVRKHYPVVKVMRIEVNRGIAEAQDKAYRAMKTEYIISLHNDAICRRGWLSGLVKAMDSAPKNVAAIEGGIVQPDKKPLSGMPNIALTNSNKDRSDGRIMYPATCSMIFRNGILDHYQDPEYYFYYDDFYFGWLFRIAGYDILRSHGSWVDHLGSKSEVNMSVKKHNQFVSERNRFWMMLTFFSTGTILKLLPLFCAYTTVNFAGSLARSRWKSLPWLKAYLWLAAHPAKVVEKRRAIQRYRKVHDSAITPFMTCMLPSPMGRVSRAYCRLMRIKTMESE